MRIDETPTAYGLATRYGLTYWPGACPLCGDRTHDGRVLQDGPGVHGEARYRCTRCGTTTNKSRWVVALEVRKVLS